MSSIEVKSFSNADEVNDAFYNAHIEAASVCGQMFVNLTLHSGLRRPDTV